NVHSICTLISRFPSSLPSSFLLFFFPSPAPPRALHSFPTRRSSDLFLRGNKTARGAAEQDRLQPSRSTDTARHFNDVSNGREREDRKSTRLNSSHDQISYAVFCLKKKKKTKKIKSNTTSDK